MQKLTFVIGANAAGKTYFIEHHLANEKAVVLDVYDYQQKVYDEHGNKELITFEEQFRCLKKANEKHLHDIINELKQGNDVIAEQTFFKAKRRIAYIDEIRKAMDVKIEVYVMHPSNERWMENSKNREDIENIEVYENQKKQMEFPNPAEGFDAIFEVVDDEIILRMDDIKPEIVKQARQELTEEELAEIKEKQRLRERNAMYQRRRRAKFMPKTKAIRAKVQETEIKEALENASAKAEKLLMADNDTHIAEVVAGENKVYVDTGIFPTAEEVKEKYAI